VKKQKVPQSAQIALVVVGLLLVVVLGWFALISPQRSSAANVQKEIADTQHQIDDARALTLKAKKTQKIRVADLFKLTKAMPDQADEAGIILELNQVANESGISFDSITPQGSVALSGYQVVPITVIFQGNFYDLADFLFRLRNLVDVRRGALDAQGRLYAVDSIGFDEGDQKFPQIKATLGIDAFVYGTGTVATVAPPQATPAAGSTTSTSTTPTGTTPTSTAPGATTPASTTPATTTPTSTTPAPSSPPSSGASAAGVTP
jgi:cell division septation protein DedD